MPARKKTREEIANQMFLNIADIKHLLDVSQQSAKRIYLLADEIDSDKSNLPHRIEPAKVRITSVCKATGFTLETLKKQAIKKGTIPNF